MKYTYPEITVLGDAPKIIQAIGKVQISYIDFVVTIDWRLFQPAYDLDE